MGFLIDIVYIRIFAPYMVDFTSKYVGKELKINGEIINPNLAFLIEQVPNFRYLVMQGATRSGKTYAALQYIWAQIQAYQGVKYSITRQSMPTLKGTVLPDFQEIGRDMGLYNTQDHNLTESIYRYNGNVVDLFGAEDEEKIRGRKRDFLYMNEAPELQWPVVQQLQFRTSRKIIIDYNPSYAESWVYENILTRPDCAFIKTTYKDNPHLTPDQISDIEWMQLNDPDGYLIYGMGERGEIKGQIYNNWRKLRNDKFPTDANWWGIDFGFSQDPATISQFKFDERTLYARNRLYQTGLSNIDLMIHMYFMGINDSSDIVADSAEPKTISELRNGIELGDEWLKTKVGDLGFIFRHHRDFDGLKERMKNGYIVNAAFKGPDSVRNGIKRLKEYEILLTEDSTHAWAEYTKYKYIVDPHTGRTTATPKDANNHFCDPMRYVAQCRDRILR